MNIMNIPLHTHPNLPGSPEILRVLDGIMIQIF
jgi:hypothetical protein